jgi:hypothetical protein
MTHYTYRNDRYSLDELVQNLLDEGIGYEGDLAEAERLLRKAKGESIPELMRRRGPFCFYAFDLLWLDGRDLRDLPLSERKTLLRKLLPRPSQSVLYVNHFASGTDLSRVICDRDMEGIVAKQASAKYTPEATTWVKIKNREYSQAVGREDFFDRRRAYPTHLQSRSDGPGSIFSGEGTGRAAELPSGSKFGVRR